MDEHDLKRHATAVRWTLGAFKEVAFDTLRDLDDELEQLPWWAWRRRRRLERTWHRVFRLADLLAEREQRWAL